MDNVYMPNFKMVRAIARVTMNLADSSCNKIRCHVPGRRTRNVDTAIKD